MTIRIIHNDGTLAAADLIRESIRTELVNQVLGSAGVLDVDYLTGEFFEPGSSFEDATWRAVAEAACTYVGRFTTLGSIEEARSALADLTGAAGALMLCIAHREADRLPAEAGPDAVWTQITEEHQQARVVAQLLALVAYAAGNDAARVRAASAELAAAANTLMPDGTDEAVRARHPEADGK